MLNVPLDTKWANSGTLFPDNLLASTEKKNEKQEEAKYKT